MGYQTTIRGVQPAADWEIEDPLVNQFEICVNSDDLKEKVNWSSVPTLWSELEYRNAAGTTGATKASGADVDTGTNDTKFVTAKALSDSLYAAKVDSDLSGYDHDASPAGTSLIGVWDGEAFVHLTLEELAAVIDGILNP